MDNNPSIIINDILHKYILDCIKDNNSDFNYFIPNNLNYDILNDIYEYTINKLDNFNDNNYNINENKDNKDNKDNIKDNIKDPWECAINDNKFYINNKVARIFPLIKNFNNYGKIQIDEESFSFITIREIAELISKIICYHLLEYNLNPQKISIIDYTAGVGGNVLSFSKFFNKIFAVEISEIRSDYLKNNIEIYGYKNIYVYNKCALEFNSEDMIEINPSVIFIDPPWGGNEYKNNDNLLLNLGNKPIEELLIDIISKFSNHYLKLIDENSKEKYNNYNNKIILLKLPKNYDIEYLYEYIKKNNNFKNYIVKSYLYILNKMLIVVCELYYI